MIEMALSAEEPGGPLGKGTLRSCRTKEEGASNKVERDGLWSRQGAPPEWEDEGRKREVMGNEGADGR